MVYFQVTHWAIVCAWIIVTAIKAGILRSSLFSEDEFYKEFLCSGTFVGNFSLIACSWQCFLQDSTCIGLVHNELSSGCVLLTSDTGSANCDDWSAWRAYGKLEAHGEPIL